MEIKKNERVTELLELITKLTKKDMLYIQNFLVHQHELDNKYFNEDYNKNRSGARFLSLAERDKIDIIGGLPFLLNSTKYFKTSDDIKNFATEFLNIHIPKGNKTRSELIGITVIGILKMPPYQTKNIRNILNMVMEKVTKYKTSDIFLEWEKAFKRINFDKQ